jgi:hypothetical protein
MALPLHLLFCPTQGRYNTNKADVFIFMLSRLQAAFAREGIDLGRLNRPIFLDRFLGLLYLL